MLANNKLIKLPLSPFNNAGTLSPYVLLAFPTQHFSHETLMADVSSRLFLPKYEQFNWMVRHNRPSSLAGYYVMSVRKLTENIVLVLENS